MASEAKYILYFRKSSKSSNSSSQRVGQKDHPLYSKKLTEWVLLYLSKKLYTKSSKY